MTKKITNEYSEVLGRLYVQTPKAVLAALLVSEVIGRCEHLDEVSANVLDEWQTLYDNGIVPQRPPKAAQP